MRIYLDFPKSVNPPIKEMINIKSNHEFIINQPQIRSDVSGLLALASGLPLKENLPETHAEPIQSACLRCPFLRNVLNCR